MLSFSEAGGYEVAADGVRVCAVAPGPVNTAFHERMGAEARLVPPVAAATGPELWHGGPTAGSHSARASSCPV